MSASDAYQKPPGQIRAVYKNYQKLSPTSLATDMEIVDFERGLNHEQYLKFKEVRRIPGHLLLTTYSDFGEMQTDLSASVVDVPIFEHDDLPGDCLRRVAVHNFV